MSFNLQGTVTYVAVNSAAYFAIKATGILEKFPGYERMLDSGRDVQIALATGGAMTVSQELLKIIMPETYGQSNLLLGQLLSFADLACYNSMVCYGMVKSGLHEGIGETFEQYGVPVEISEALVNGVTIGLADFLRFKLIERANQGAEAGWIRWVLQPLRTISDTAGLGLQ
jgi:hypothetical protein